MTSLATRPMAIRSIGGRIRSAALLLAVVLVALGSHAFVPGGPLTGPAQRAASPGAGSALARPAAPGAPDAPTADEAATATIEQSLERWSRNLHANPKDFISATNIALLYSGRGRLTGAVEDHSRALEAADIALEIEPDHGPARALRALMLATLHDFPRALAEAEALYRDDPSQLQALATIGDARLELGDVAGAEAAFNELAELAPGAPATARLAQLAAVRGDATEAAALADRAISEAAADGSAGPALGWYRLLAGTIAFRDGDLAAAEHYAEAAARDWPKSVAVLTLQARVAAATGRTAAAIDLLTRAIATKPEPASLALLGDLYTLTGRADLADAQYATIGAVAALAAQAGVHDRTLALFAADHGRDVEAAVASTARALETRKDVYGYDAYAWSLYAAGRAADAREPMARVLELGTRDATLWYHAGMIELAAGDRAAGIDWLRRALDLNPGFDPLGALRAREALDAAR